MFKSNKQRTGENRGRAEAGKEIYKAKTLSDQNVGMGRDGGSIYKKDRGRG